MIVQADQAIPELCLFGSGESICRIAELQHARATRRETQRRRRSVGAFERWSVRAWECLIRIVGRRRRMTVLRYGVIKKYFAVGPNLLDGGQRRNFIVQHLFRVDDRHTFSGGEPKLAISRFAGGRVALLPVHFGAEQTIPFAVLHYAHYARASRGNRVQLLLTHPVNSVVIADPKPSKIVFEDAIDLVVWQPLVGSEGRDVSVLEPRQAVLGADPQHAFSILVQAPDVIA